MTKYLPLLFIINFALGQDCTADDGTEGVELWGECYNLEETTWLDLSGSGLTGLIPSEIGQLTNLTTLYLNNNQLTGEIPSEIGNCINLGWLRLNDNDLVGEVPLEIGNLINLTFFDLSYNQFTGDIPLEIGNLMNLTYLTFHSNQLTGQIPSEIGTLMNLTILNLYSNQLTGEIPSEIGNLTNLTYLGLSSNQLIGEIPLEIGNLTNLSSLILDNNQLTGEISSEIGNLTDLYVLKLGDNQLNGIIPQEICNLINMYWSSNETLGYSYLFNNNLCPPYPSCIEDYVGGQDTTNCEQVSIIDETLPITYNLYNAYPNPFNPLTTLKYDLPEDAMVNITIYDMMGRVVKTLINDSQTAGYKSIRWNATNDRNEPVSAGLYLYTIQAGKFRQTKKMVLLK